MPNLINNFKRQLEFLTLEEQLREINYLIKKFNRSYSPCVNISKTFNMIKYDKSTKYIKKELLINRKLS